MNNEKYLAIPLAMVIPGISPFFAIYIFTLQSGYVLWARNTDKIDSVRLGKLHDIGFKEVFIDRDDQPQYEQYLEQHLEKILKWNRLQTMKRYKKLTCPPQNDHFSGEILREGKSNVSAETGMERCKFSHAQILKIIDESEMLGTKNADIYRKYKVPIATFYYWKFKYGPMDIVKLSAKGENPRLKEHVRIS